MSRPAILEDLTWGDDAMDALEAQAATGKPFDAYQMQQRQGLRDPDQPNQWGPLFREGSRRGIIQAVGYHESQRPGRSGGACRVWVGNKKTKNGLGSIRQDITQTATPNR
ncbi:hypothetical protein MB46_03405 [Arthrobacter alpinus]|nr:hypothetical protein MB46_03405 [Arthrobacter alpinus]